MKTYLLLFFCLFGMISYGQGHLVPEKNDYKGESNQYYEAVFSLLYKGFSKKPTARFTSMPSFTNEYAFSVEKKNDDFIIKSNALSGNYWITPNKKEVKTISNQAKISQSLYNQINLLFELITLQTKEPEKIIFGNDGTIYYFSTTVNNKIKTGKTWSPNKETMLGRLVKLNDDLFQIGMGKAVDQKVVETGIKQLSSDLKK